MTRRRMVLVALVAAVLAVGVTGGAWASARDWDGWPGGMMTADHDRDGAMPGGAGWLGDRYGLAGDGRPVESMAAARQRAQVFAGRLDLRVGEVMRFSDGFYAELVTPAGQGATEVLVDAADGGVTMEYGPAMMWNSRYGMHGDRAGGSDRVSVAEVAAIAQRWLDGRRPDLSAGEPEEFPGYYTLHTLRGGKVVGMMSVNAGTGAVWYHTWHGGFVAMDEG